jgi:chemotaxis protein methyltransferase WspC
MWEVGPEVRQCVRLVHANVLDAGRLPFAPVYDAIFCRNLLIYLDREARSALVATLARLLAPAGILFVGHAECLPELDAGFVRCEERGTFAYRPRTRAPQAAAASDHRPAPRPVAPPPRHPKRANQPARAPAKKPRAKETTPTPPDLLAEAATLANAGRYDEAIATCDRHVRTRGPSARAYFDLGMIYQASGDCARAEQALEKSVYLDGKHEDALLALALLARRRGDLAAERRYRQRASRAGAGERKP